MNLPLGSKLYSIWLDFFRQPWQRKYIMPLVMINALGSLYGYYWYHHQLAGTPVYSWPFVPDSPLSTTLFALALWGHLRGMNSSLFKAVACTASIKYGLWAVVLISHFWYTGGQVTATETMLWLSHLGMAAQGLIFLRRVRLAGPVVIITASWMALNDFVDYAYGLHPYLFAAGQLGVAAVSAMGLTLLLAMAMVWLGRAAGSESRK